MASSYPQLPPIFRAENVPASALPKPKIWVQEDAPTSTTGYKVGDYVLDAAGDVHRLKKEGNVLSWELLTNIQGPQGAAGEGLTPQAEADLTARILEDTESDIDLVFLFEQALS